MIEGNNLDNRAVTRIRDPYADWYLVYKVEVTDRIKHWPANRKAEMEGIDNVNEGLAERVLG